MLSILLLLGATLAFKTEGLPKYNTLIGSEQSTDAACRSTIQKTGDLTYDRTISIMTSRSTDDPDHKAKFWCKDTTWEDVNEEVATAGPWEMKCVGKYEFLHVHRDKVDRHMKGFCHSYPQGHSSQ